ncbi:hypothetical protein MMC21_005488 [Puttea exsequens]|nr:hypothetical protein [Puttea exsequens]
MRQICIDLGYRIRPSFTHSQSTVTSVNKPKPGRPTQHQIYNEHIRLDDLQSRNDDAMWKEVDLENGSTASSPKYPGPIRKASVGRLGRANADKFGLVEVAREVSIVKSRPSSVTDVARMEGVTYTCTIEAGNDRPKMPSRRSG